jgi:hypothetical protein
MKPESIPPKCVLSHDCHVLLLQHEYMSQFKVNMVLLINSQPSTQGQFLGFTQLDHFSALVQYPNDQ